MSMRRPFTHRWCVAAVLALAVVACRQRSAPPSDGTASGSVSDSSAGGTPPDSVSITLERGPCYGTCPVYSLAISGRGEVRFEGVRFVARQGTVTDTVSGDSVRALVAGFSESNYFGFADRYRYGEPGCEPYHTDAPNVITSITLGARTKRVEHDRGCGGAPAALAVLENRIDEIVRVSRWTTGEPPR
jgi:hypothetical protein